VPLSELRLEVVGILAEVCEWDLLLPPDKPTSGSLESLPSPSTWRVLTALLFAYPHSDLFHCQVKHNTEKPRFRDKLEVPGLSPLEMRGCKPSLTLCVTPFTV
jgi:hypothetical protein